MPILLTLAAMAALSVPTEAQLFMGQPVKTTVNARGSGIPNTVVSRREGKVCKSILVTGSRLGATSVCKSQKEWDDMAALYRQNVERQQVGPYKTDKNPG